MKLWKETYRLGSRELAQARRSDIAGRLFRVLRVLEQRRPEHVRNSLQLAVRAVRDDLQISVRTRWSHTAEKVVVAYLLECV